MNNQTGTLYLLHFSKPYRHARHYLGFTAHNDAKKRVAAHISGHGSNLTQHVHQSAIEMYLAWQGQGTRADERRLKRSSHVARWCPICVAQVAAQRAKGAKRKEVQA